MAEWNENCNRVIHPKLEHGKTYHVRTSEGYELKALFNVYEGGEEVAFILPVTKKELSVTHFYA